jgi:hypothetical protein
MAKITFSAFLPVDDDVVRANDRHARALGLMFTGKIAAHNKRLAVVGGGPSLRTTLPELKAWEGDIWAINGAYGFLRTQGIEATLLSLDPHPIVAKWAPGATKALLSTRCDPSVFAILKDADVRLIELNDDGRAGICAGSSTATAAFDLGTDLGYRSITFFGCEGSYPQGATHAYQDEARDMQFLVACNGGEYLTAADFYVQSVEMAQVIRLYPQHFHERSGGLLAALIAEPEHDIIKVSRALAAVLAPVEVSA